MGNHVFICYARKDNDFVLKLATNLKNLGVSVWLDRCELKAGEDWDLVIENAIRDCVKFLIVLSPNAIASQEVRGELQVALDENKPVTPVMYRPCPIPRQLRTVQSIDYSSSGPADEVLLQRVIRALEGREPITLKLETDKVRSLPSTLVPSRKSWLLVVSFIFVALLAFYGAVQMRKWAEVQRQWRVEKEAEQKRAEEVWRRREEEQLQAMGMVKVPAGEFFMGCNEKEEKECGYGKKPGRMVGVGEFFIDKMEVRVAEYRQCVRVGKCLSAPNLTSSPFCNWEKAGRDEHPINCVTWDQAQAYCEWVSKRLPREVEWEKAARGTDGRKYPWGNKDYSYNELEKVANLYTHEDGLWGGMAYFEGRYRAGLPMTTPVGSFPAGKSPYGALDMVGNVWEWTSDWYDEKQKSRSIRGGSWGDRLENAHVRRRVGVSLDANGSKPVLGFRCAKSLEPS